MDRKSSSTLNFVELLYDALRSEVGLIVETNDAERLRQKLYSVRREASDPDLAKLRFIPSPTNSLELWIVKKELSSGKG